MKLTVSTCIFATILVMSGCGRDGLAPVSGTITNNGQPLENVYVVFNPEVDGDNHFPGPFSTATTDSNGRFTLKTKDGSNGAVIGSHSVGFTWADVSPIEMSMLQEELAMTSLAPDPAAARAAIEQKIRDTKEKMANRPALNQAVQRTFKVAPGGTSSADFDLGKK